MNEDRNMTTGEAAEATAAGQETPRERLARLRSLQVVRAKRDAEEAEAAELARLELVERFEKELGREGRAFVVVDASTLGEGHMVLKLADNVHWQTYKASKMDVVDTETFVVPSLVYPPVDEYRKIVARRGFLAERCATALATLYGLKGKDDAGKS